MSGVLSMTASSWLGPSSLSMLGASTDYFRWLMQMTAQAEERMALTTASANAFETAYAGVVHPMMIAENRTQLMTLIATNFMGVNSPAIAATEAQYAEMWAQDSSALYAYAAEAATIASAAQGSPFLPPDLSTSPAGVAAQGAAVAADAGESTGQAASTVGSTSLGSMPGNASSMASMIPSAMSAATGSLQQLASPLQSATGALSQFGSMFSSLLGPSAASSLLSAGTGATGALGSVPSASASMGKAMSLPSVMSRSDGVTQSRLSVPASWAGSVERQSAKEASAATALTEEEEGSSVMAAPRGGMVPAGLGAGKGGGGSTGVQQRPKYLPRTKVTHRYL
jgi:PPE-repeat protein